jgi:hypothetical protein
METTGTDKAPSEAPITPPPEGDPRGDEMSEQDTRDVESDAPNTDAGGRAHTSSTEGHPAGDGARSDRDMGGPVPEEGAGETEGGATGDRPSGFDSH